MSEKKTNVIGLGIFLGIVSAIAAGLLAGVAMMTAPQIAKNELAATMQALSKVMPPFDNIKAKVFVWQNGNATKIEIENEKNKKQLAKLDNALTLFIVEQNKQVVGVAGQAYSSKGYAGRVYAMVGMTKNGTIRKVIITKQNETPGLGTVVTDRVRINTIFDILGMSPKKSDTLALPPNAILDQFDGHSVAKSDKWSSPWKVKKDGGQADFITGATITSRAVTGVVYKIASTYSKNQKDIFKTLESSNTLVEEK